ncbi:glycerone kinase [Salmonella enterica]|jgi:triose/dihydroxyacetone kinase / FAD-AMP lyase (cyclizing)|uniref:Glycerone kinase n=43 Tax=Gammaproteobacteria TaxID=1236 RepID=A0A401AWZ9_SALSE|nr:MULTISPECIES: glycerone kinase [Enterobacteriaceae]EAA5839288.1 glycerone kinase [Salmonella enterica subsp. enterica serovar Tennessee]EAA8711754.1 glycerone kinase [Salmonella enterica subsp. enterica serovar Derby]EAW1159631.1 glycerone kinase [Salmonella enterica subsp. enterica]EBH8708552.1 glycerone kinase [Salmonella enterica subsp. enterica serovar Newport]EBK1734110.1 glycerone kinase [Salmonella enterica subsp. enterica serovar Heidelberg]EBM7750656.1 glycerone kinase [Salmonella
MSQFFFNQRASLVNDVIEGTIIASPWNNLARLESDPAIRVVVRRDLNKNNVAVISGGGSGHEPAHVGFIGKGMLTAAVCGDLFASPSVDAVLTAIQAVTGEAGCLLIVKNYTGDRLNFGLAAEKARRLGYNVEMLIVGDDISLPDNKQPRGIAGTILVHKVAGYFAERGFNLATVLREAQYAANNTFSLGVALSSCHLPQEAESAPRHQPGHAELGMGIHGEPGASTIATHNSAEIMQIMVEKLTAALPETGRLAVMLNNLGGVSVAEMAILTRELANTPLHARVDWLIGPASLVTALDMKGFSLTTIVLEESIEKALLSDVETASWQKPVQPRAVNIMPSALASARVAFTPSANPQVGDYVAQVTSTLSGLETHLNALDAKVGDGDTGSTFAAGARAIAALLQRQQLPLNDLPTLFALIGERLTVVMGGSSGVLMSIFFTAAGQKLEQGASMAEALNAGLGQMKFYGGADEGDRTMIDALQPALAALLAEPDNLQAAFAAAQAGADRTCQSSKAGAGRASYLNSESLLGNMDPGAHAVAMVFKALAER